MVKEVYAACTGFLDCLGGIATPGLSVGSEKKLPARIISDFLPSILTIAGFITMIVIFISGIQFILSSGNPEAAATARGRLIFALVGFALIVLSYAILQIVNLLFLGTRIVI